VNKQIVAAFDFDGTLTYHDTYLPFLCYSEGYLKTALGIGFSLPVLATCYCHTHYRQIAKEAILKNVLGGVPMDAARRYGEQFALGPLQTKIRPEAVKKLKWHQEQGHRCVLISANLDIYLEPWALNAGFHDLICSRIEADRHGKLTGKLIGLNCWGPEKTRRLNLLLGSKENFMLYAYGDSKGDLPLLNLADHPYYRRFE
jgi:phosphatidylglycerophosphatase C